MGTATYVLNTPGRYIIFQETTQGPPNGFTFNNLSYGYMDITAWIPYDTSSTICVTGFVSAINGDTLIRAYTSLNSGWVVESNGSSILRVFKQSLVN